MLKTFGEGKMYFVAKFHPDPDKQNVLMAGCSDKKIYQWDMDTGDLVQVDPNSNPKYDDVDVYV